MTVEQQLQILKSWPMIIALSMVSWGYAILAFTYPECTIVDKITAIVTLIGSIIIIII